MSEIEKLKGIISNKFHIKLRPNKYNNFSQLIIEEHTKNTKLEKVIIDGFEGTEKNIFAFKLDSIKKCNKCNKNLSVGLSYLFNSSAEYINKGCDAIIFYKCTKNFYVFICELKSDNPKEKQFISQMKNSGIFVEYINMLLENFYNISLKQDNKINTINILFTTRNQNQRLTTVKNNKHKKVNDYFECNCNTNSTIQINEFIT